MYMDLLQDETKFPLGLIHGEQAWGQTSSAAVRTRSASLRGGLDPEEQSFRLKEATDWRMEETHICSSLKIQQRDGQAHDVFFTDINA